MYAPRFLAAILVSPRHHIGDLDFDQRVVPVPWTVDVGGTRRCGRFLGLAWNEFGCGCWVCEWLRTNTLNNYGWTKLCSRFVYVRRLAHRCILEHKQPWRDATFRTLMNRLYSFVKVIWLSAFARPTSLTQVHVHQTGSCLLVFN